MQYRGSGTLLWTTGTQSRHQIGLDLQFALTNFLYGRDRAAALIASEQRLTRELVHRFAHSVLPSMIEATRKSTDVQGLWTATADFSSNHRYSFQEPERVESSVTFCSHLELGCTVNFDRNDLSAIQAVGLLRETIGTAVAHAIIHGLKRRYLGAQSTVTSIRSTGASMSVRNTPDTVWN